MSDSVDEVSKTKLVRVAVPCMLYVVGEEPVASVVTIEYRTDGRIPDDMWLPRRALPRAATVLEDRVAA